MSNASDASPGIDYNVPIVAGIIGGVAILSFGVGLIWFIVQKYCKYPPHTGLSSLYSSDQSPTMYSSSNPRSYPNSLIASSTVRSYTDDSWAPSRADKLWPIEKAVPIAVMKSPGDRFSPIPSLQPQEIALPAPLKRSSIYSMESESIYSVASAPVDTQERYHSLSIKAALSRRVVDSYYDVENRGLSNVVTVIRSELAPETYAASNKLSPKKYHVDDSGTLLRRTLSRNRTTSESDAQFPDPMQVSISPLNIPKRARTLSHPTRHGHYQLRSHLASTTLSYNSSIPEIPPKSPLRGMFM